jgi:hypothetical protein
VTVYSVPGFVSALFQIPIQVPTSIQSLGMDVGNGVQRAGFYLTPYFPLSYGPGPPLSSVIGVYLK